MTLEPMEDPLDKPVIPIAELLNSLPGVTTYASCSGHGYDKGYISFTCDNFGSLLRIIKAVYSIRWKVGSELDPKKHLWTVVIFPIQDYPNSLVLSIRYVSMAIPQKFRKRIKMQESWKVLEESLKEWNDV